MDITKAKAAVENARKVLAETVNATIEAGKKNSREFNGLKSLAGADTSLEKAIEKLDDAVAKTQPREKKERKSKKKAA